MDIVARKQNLKGEICVPGSKSHTIRALLLASLANGVSTISNPLASADCISTSKAIPLIGAKFFKDKNTWKVEGAGKNIHLPCDVVNVGNSGSLLYFLSPIAATFNGWSIFTGDESIRSRPVSHVVDALTQLGCASFISRPQKDAPPLLIKGPINKYKVTTDGSLSQYISGMMMAALLLNETLEITLTSPKETPYLTMTKLWLEQCNVAVNISSDFKNISVKGPVSISAFNKTIPSDWEAIAFPLIAALISDSEIIINNIDSDGSQGDEKIVSVLQSVGADISYDLNNKTLSVRGGKYAKSILSTKSLPSEKLHINISSFPDAICAISVISCFIEGTTVIEDIDICRQKETDRIAVMKKELSKLGADIFEEDGCLIINGHSPITETGEKNDEFILHGGTVESYDDHRVAMALSCLALGLPDGEVLTVKNAECCSVSFPNFIDAMNGIGSKFNIVNNCVVNNIEKE